MRLNNYILEDKADKYTMISEKKAMEIVKAKCSDAHNSDTRLFRGLNRTDPAFIYKPSLSPRHSKIRIEFLMLLADNLPSWKEYPKRSLSISTITGKMGPGEFGSVLYRVYPFNGAKLAVCPAIDFNQGSFKKSLGDIGEARLLYYLQDIFDKIFNLKGNIEKWTDFVKVLSLCDKNKDKIEKWYRTTQPELVQKYFIDHVKYFGRNISFLDALDEALDPKKNGFRIANIKTQIPEGKEVWTDSDCVLIFKGKAERRGFSELIK
jgi:hypothetical protein